MWLRERWTLPPPTLFFMILIRKETWFPSECRKHWQKSTVAFGKLSKLYGLSSRRWEGHLLGGCLGRGPRQRRESKMATALTQTWTTHYQPSLPFQRPLVQKDTPCSTAYPHLGKKNKKQKTGRHSRPPPPPLPPTYGVLSYNGPIMTYE